MLSRAVFWKVSPVMTRERRSCMSGSSQPGRSDHSCCSALSSAACSVWTCRHPAVVSSLLWLGTVAGCKYVAQEVHQLAPEQAVQDPTRPT